MYNDKANAIIKRDTHCIWCQKHGIDVGYNFKIRNSGDFTSFYASSVAFLEFSLFYPSGQIKNLFL